MLVTRLGLWQVKGKKMVTIRDVAQEAGVSIGSVSRYLNGKTLRQENAAAIQRAIKKLGYRENIIAKSLKNSKSHSVGVVVNTLTDVFATSIISHLELYLEQHNYSLVLCDYRHDRKTLERKLQFLESRSVDGVVVFHVEKSVPTLVRMKKGSTAVVCVDAPLKDLKTDTVLVNNRQAAYEATERLVSLGHRRIGMVAGDPTRYIGAERLEGYRDCLREHGLLDDSLAQIGGYSLESGHEGAQVLLERHPEMTALFAVNYYATLGAYQAILESGRSIPADISLMGFDHFEISDIIRPQLTVIEQPVAEMGEAIGRMLIERIEHPDMRQTSTVELECNLLWRDSVRKPKV